MESPTLTSSIYYEDDNLQALLSQLGHQNSVQQEGEKDAMKEKESIQYSMSGNCLKVSDFPPLTDDIELEYTKIKSGFQRQMPKLERDLSQCDVNRPLHESIYKARCIESIVEQTYNYDYQLREQMTEEACYLKKITMKWRRVAGDGNCFYRSAIFAWLEYLVFNSQIDVFKRIITDLKNKFAPSYENTKILSSTIKANLSSLTSPVPSMILESIVSQLSNSSYTPKQRIQSAYMTLLKGFNFSRLFDTAMIYYLRYILYEFILENQDKVFSKDFPVLLGNLLPAQYENDEGKFFFMNYFEEDLLKFYTCAEKLAIYLTPFVLKIDLKVIFYDFGPECNIQTKFFSSYLPDKGCLYVFYRKLHYDICYSPEYYNKYREMLGLYQEERNSNKIIKDNEITKFEEEMDDVDTNQSKIFLRKVSRNPHEAEIKKELKIAKKKVNLYKKCSICSNVCNELISKPIVLPCKCKLIFCQDKCSIDFINKFSSYINAKLLTEAFKCFQCECIFSKEELIEIAFLIKINLQQGSVLLDIRKKFIEVFECYCMLCLHEFTESEKKYIIQVKAPLFNKIVDKMKCNHALCKECLNKQPLICKICSCYHSRVMNK